MQYRLSRSLKTLTAFILAVAIQVGASGIRVHAQAPQQVAEKPWAAFWVSSIARMLTDCDVIYESIDRHDLAESIEERQQKSYREFGGIDRTRPLGMMWTWDDVKDPPAIIFVPVQDINELMATASFGVVDYHLVKENQYEIERPGAPYHVLVRSGNALFGEEIPALHALREAPERMTKELREKYDMVLMVDQRQVPRDAKQAWIDALRKQFEPWLQAQDDESKESATLRGALGKSLLDSIGVLIQDVQSITLAGRINRRTRQLQFDLMLQAEPGSKMAGELNRMVVQRSQFSALVNRDASAGLAINWPVMLLGKDLVAAVGPDSAGGRIDFGVQLVGSNWSDMTLVAGIRGAEASALNAVIPHLLSRMEKSPDVTSVHRNTAQYRAVDLHQIAPSRIPDLLQPITPPGVEILLGQGKQVVWLAAGLPATLQDRLKAAVDSVEDAPKGDRSNAVMQGRLSIGKWPAVVPVIDPQDTQSELSNAKDGFSMSVQPIRNGLKIEFIAEEGLLRVIGRHWAKQVDRDAAFR
jgi:hypothetical protein